MVTILPVVEGHGEVRSIPHLIRRVLQEAAQRYDIDVGHAIRQPSGSLWTPGGMERAVRLALARPRCDALLVLTDREDGCPKTDGPILAQELERALRSVGCTEMLAAAVLAYREVETWFLAALDSPGFQTFVRPGSAPPAHPESRRDAKGWLEQFLLAVAYDSSADQLTFAARLNLTLARAGSDSFDKFCREVIRLGSAFPSAGL